MATVRQKLNRIEVFEKHRTLWCAKLIAFIGLGWGAFALVYERFDFEALLIFLGCLCLWLIARDSTGLWDRLERLEAEASSLRSKPIE
jgi:hypothetical protein